MTHSQASTAEDFYVLEEYFSEHSEDERQYSHRNEKTYLTTNVITPMICTLADITVHEVTPEDIKERKVWALAASKSKECRYGIVDPREEWNRRKREDNLTTLVDFGDIQLLADMAQQLYMGVNSDDEEEK